MEMQDNEFDDLFRSKLDSFEMEPSANVWQGVNANLQSRKRKQVLVPLFSIAASIIVLVTAAVLFIPQKDNVIIKHTASTRASKTPQADNLSAQASNKPNIAPNIKPVETKASKPFNRIASNKTEPTKVIPVENVVIANKQESPVKPEEQTVIASLAPKPDLKNIVPGNETKLIPKQPVEETTAFTTKPVLIAEQQPVQNKPEIMPEVKPKHRIHTFGDLVNVVVAKVDKRKDKVIEFTNKDDEDESTVAGVNLGIIKFKKEK